MHDHRCSCDSQNLVAAQTDQVLRGSLSFLKPGGMFISTESHKVANEEGSNTEEGRILVEGNIRAQQQVGLPWPTTGQGGEDED